MSGKGGGRGSLIGCIKEGVGGRGADAGKLHTKGGRRKRENLKRQKSPLFKQIAESSRGRPRHIVYKDGDKLSRKEKGGSKKVRGSERVTFLLGGKKGGIKCRNIKRGGKG